MRTAQPSLACLGSATLPIVGASHPLRRAYARSFRQAVVTAAGIHLIVFGGIEVKGWMHPPQPIDMRSGRVIILPQLPQPPPIAPDPTRSENLLRILPLTPPQVGIPEPVPGLPEGTDWSPPGGPDTPLDPVSPLAGWGAGDTVVVDIRPSATEGAPSPGNFEASEDKPVVIEIPPPVYPELARQAGVEGTVLICALVGKDGHVHEASVVASVPMLDDAALDAARRAIFRPALQQHKPVPVWVQIPIRFCLQ